MTPTDQKFMHDPSNGVYGDCQRACIASLLDMPIEDVPHFLHDNTQDAAEFNQRINSFLSPLGLMHLETAAFSFSGHMNGDCYHMIYGRTVRGTYHAVVGFRGEVIHDPHPSRAALDETQKDGWTYGFLVRTGVRNE